VSFAWMACETLPQQNKALYRDASKDQQLVILNFVLLLKATMQHLSQPEIFWHRQGPTALSTERNCYRMDA
jgi:hypothetical protein